MRKTIPLDWSVLEADLLLRGFQEFGLDVYKIAEKYFGEDAFPKRSPTALLYQLKANNKISDTEFDKFLKKIYSDYKYWRKQGWSEIKKGILNRDNNSCQVCYSNENLEVHHVTRWVANQQHFPENLITLCNNCHRKITNHANNSVSREFYEKYVKSLNEVLNLKARIEFCEHHNSHYVVTGEDDGDKLYKTLILFRNELEILRILKEHKGTGAQFLHQYSNFLPVSQANHVTNLEEMQLIIHEHGKSPKTGRGIKVYYLTILGGFVKDKAINQLIKRFKLPVEEIIPKFNYIKINITEDGVNKIIKENK